MNVFVVGGGASGLTAAIVAKRLGNNVTIIEKNNTLGKKLLLTGNGRCNYFNEDMSLANFFSHDDVKRFINEVNLTKVTNFFDSIGLFPIIKNGYYYPYSCTSTAVLNSLLKEIKRLGIVVINEEVVNIIKEDKFIIKTNNNTYKGDKLILSTGGITYEKTGSTGFGYQILSSFGHTIFKPKEALVPLKTLEDVKEWNGIRAHAKVSFYVDNNLLGENEGEVQLTSYGISGICVMNLSRFFCKGKDNILHINFLPFINDLNKFISERNDLLKGQTVIELLESLINYKLLYFIFKKLNLNTSSKWNQLNDNEKILLINNLTNFKLNIVDTKGIDYGETTSGGVSLKEVTNNCESKLIKDLFITGELLDIDGYCGGYNLTIAWISGILAGECND